MNKDELEIYQPNGDQNTNQGNNNDINKIIYNDLDDVNQVVYNDLNTDNIDYQTNNNDSINQTNSNDINDFNTTTNISNDNQFQQSYQNVDQGNSFETKEKKPFPKFILFIIVGIIVVAGIVLLIIFLSKNTNEKNKYEELLVNAASSYYQNNADNIPTVYGECKTITLKALIDNNLISDSTLKNQCDTSKTTVKICKLKSESYNYTPTLSCNKKSLTTTYGDWTEGTETDLTKNKSDIKFMFSIKTTKLSENLDSVASETFIEDEIPYESWTYKEIDKKVVYRIRDQLYNWYTESKYYYPNNATIEAKVNEYYPTAPNNTYNNKGSSATVYKWFIGTNQVYNNGEYVSEAVDPYTVKGAKGTPNVWATTDYPGEKSYRMIENTYIYRTRKLESTDIVTNIKYHCVNDTNGNNWYSDEPCSSEASGEVGTIRADKYYCTWKNNVTDVITKSEAYQTDTCIDKYHFVNESINEGYTTTWSPTDCGWSENARPYICDRRMGYRVTDQVWKWYTPSTKTYYKTNNETTYYKESPSAQAIKDSTTSITGYTWYKTSTNNLGNHKTSPASGAIRGSQVWSDWSNWTETVLTAVTGQEVEKKNQITLKRTITNDTEWTVISNGYVTEEEAITLLKEKGYDINSLEDIFNAKDISYDIKLYYRNSK